MMNKLSILTPVLFACSIVAQDGAHAVHWYADFDEAAAVAKKENKDLLVDFTGSDWCGWCIRLHKEVFDHAEFQDGVKDHFVLVALDFPRGAEAKEQVPNPERNKELQQKYGVRGFPTILLMTPAGEVFGKTGYAAGGPVPYVESLDKMRTEGKRNLVEINELAEKYEAAKGQSRAPVLAMAIDKLAKMSPDQVGIEKIAAIVRDAVGSDDAATNEQAVAALVRSGQADDETIAAAAALDPDNKKGLYELTVKAAMSNVRDDASAKAFVAKLDDLLTKTTVDAELVEGMLSQAATWCAGPLKDADTAKKFATALKERTKDPKKHQKLFERILGDGN